MIHRSIAEIFGCRTRRARCRSHNAQPPAGMKARKKKGWVQRRWRKELRQFKRCLGNVEPEVVRCAVEDGWRGLYYRRREKRNERKRMES